MPWLIALEIGAMAVNAYGQIKAGKAAKKVGESQQAAAEESAKQLDYNAAVAHLQAEDATARGAEEESRFRTTVKGLIGSQKTGFAAGGVDVGSGSALDVAADTAYLGELDALTIRSNAAREAWGYSVQEEDLKKSASVTRKSGQIAYVAGKNAQTASRIGAGASVIGGVSMMAQRYGWGSGGGKATTQQGGTF